MSDMSYFEGYMFDYVSFKLVKVFEGEYSMWTAILEISKYLECNVIDIDFLNVYERYVHHNLYAIYEVLDSKSRAIVGYLYERKE